MTEKLRAIITQVEQLSPEQQDELAEAWAIELDERGWDERFANPRSQAIFQRMKEELAAGTVEDDECNNVESDF
jgi:hypothetical protein